MKSLNPYLTFPGNAEAAMGYYQTIFGGKVEIMRFKGSPMEANVPEAERNLVMHASLPIASGQVLMASDACSTMGPPPTVGSNFSLAFEADSDEEAARVHAALAAGGKVTLPIAKTFWGAYFGMCVDRFGIAWMVSHHQARPA
jgi:PhnB protein